MVGEPRLPGHRRRVLAGPPRRGRDAARPRSSTGCEPRPGDTALDLYGGVGLFAAALAERVGPTGRVTCVEADRVAVEDARHNLAEPPAVRVERGRVDHVLRRLRLRAGPTSSSSTRPGRAPGARWSTCSPGVRPRGSPTSPATRRRWPGTSRWFAERGYRLDRSAGLRPLPDDPPRGVRGAPRAGRCTGAYGCGVVPEASLTLPAELSSVGQARRFLRALAGRLGASTSTTSAAPQVLTELATNAALHARSAYTVHLRARGGRPAGRGHRLVARRCRSTGTTAPDATTGRGIALVEALSTAWGVESSPTGKTVWCRVAPRRRLLDDVSGDADVRRLPGGGGTRLLRRDGGPSGVRADAADGGMSTPADEELITVRLDRLPLDVQTAAQQHGDELTRELMLVAEQMHQQADGARRAAAPVRRAGGALNSQYSMFTAEQEQQLSAALGRGPTARSTCLPGAGLGGPAAASLGDILDEVDDYCRQGRLLLTLETPAPLVTYRRWFLDQFVEQSQGRPAVSWPAYLDDQTAVVQPG